MRGYKPVLLVEDNKIDAMTVERAFKNIPIKNKVINVTNGEEALSYLRDSANTKPCIILLDLNMPVMDGLEFLKIAKKDQEINHIPIIVLTTNEEPTFRIKSFQTGVSGYMIKPVDYVQFLEVIKTINLYWTFSELPE